MGVVGAACRQSLMLRMRSDIVTMSSCFSQLCIFYSVVPGVIWGESHVLHRPRHIAGGIFSALTPKVLIRSPATMCLESRQHASFGVMPLQKATFIWLMPRIDPENIQNRAEIRHHPLCLFAIILELSIDPRRKATFRTAVLGVSALVCNLPNFPPSQLPPCCLRSPRS